MPSLSQEPSRPEEEVPSQRTRLKTLIVSYYFRPGLEFLSGVAHHFSLGTA